MGRKQKDACSKPPQLAALDMKKRLKKKDYEKALSEVQVDLQQIQQAFLRQKKNAVIVFEGWDAAGKGGTIRRMSSVLDPRGFKVWPIAAPHPYYQERHYLARFWDRLPPDGTIAAFDRSWYGRVLVERVEGFASDEAWRRAYNEINDFEKLLTDSGTPVLKFFLHIDPDVQLQRFHDRLLEPLKRWKLSPDDFRNRGKWDAYDAAIDEMFRKTHSENAPWIAVPANDKKYARIAILKQIAKILAKEINLSLPPLDPDVLKAALELFDLDAGTVEELRQAT